ncbi:MAG: hypothetical protein ACRBG0_21430 [Lewinella sp.]|jgi:hypothetical protein|uniref:hypothetical protein n=1 Tax=Lewinella sp. TaxID=2004506 RepID=UPI003D6A1780
MQLISKYGPIILLTIALASLYLQWATYQAATADCGCQDKQVADSGTGPIV